MIRENAIPRRIVFSWRIVGGKNARHRPAYKIACVIQYIKHDCGWEHLIHIYGSVIASVFTKKTRKMHPYAGRATVTSNLYLWIDNQFTLIEKFRVKRAFVPEFFRVPIIRNFFCTFHYMYRITFKGEEKNAFTFSPSYYLF